MFTLMFRRCVRNERMVASCVALGSIRTDWLDVAVFPRCDSSTECSSMNIPSSISTEHCDAKIRSQPHPFDPCRACFPLNNIISRQERRKANCSTEIAPPNGQTDACCFVPATVSLEINRRWVWLEASIGKALERFVDSRFAPDAILLWNTLRNCDVFVECNNFLQLDVAFGPACDYVLATANRILSFSKVPMFTSAGFSEWFKDKANNAELMTRVGPLQAVHNLQDHIALMIEQLSDRFGWVRPTLFYQKAFWESELLESGFCKMMMTGLFVRSANKQSNLSPNPRILPNYEGDGGIREVYAQNLIDNVGVERAGWSYL
uniref:HET domain-containing protein n=1 Tax=Ascaris lumbricoides TaxID=6252 RepID=A0A0M3HS45_ASCLU